MVKGASSAMLLPMVGSSSRKVKLGTKLTRDSRHFDLGCRCPGTHLNHYGKSPTFPQLKNKNTSTSEKHIGYAIGLMKW